MPVPLGDEAKRETGVAMWEHPQNWEHPQIPNKYWDKQNVFSDKGLDALPSLPHKLFNRNITGGQTTQTQAVLHNPETKT